MGRKLNTYVDLRDANGVPHTFGPDDDVPSWAAERISNDSAWADDDNAEPDAESVADGDKPRRGRPPKQRIPQAGQASDTE